MAFSLPNDIAGAGAFDGLSTAALREQLDAIARHLNDLEAQIAAGTGGGSVATPTIEQVLTAGAVATTKPQLNGGVKLGTASVVGQVWKATDTAGNGAWDTDATGGGGGGAGGAGLPTVDTGPVNAPNAMDDEFDGGSLASKWVWFNQGSATAVPDTGKLAVYTPAAGGEDHHHLEQPLVHVGGVYRYEAQVSWMGAAVNYNWIGIALRESATQRVETCVMGFDSGTGAYAGGHRWSNNGTNWVATLGARSIFGNRGYVAIGCDGTNIYIEWSIDGANWNRLASWAKNVYFAGIPDKIGLCWQSGYGGQPLWGSFEWFRVGGWQLAASATSSPSYIPALSKPVLADFAWVNQGGATAGATTGGFHLYDPYPGLNAMNGRILKKAAPGATPWTLEIAFIPRARTDSGSVWPECGIALRESGTGKWIAFQYFQSGAAVEVCHMSDPATFAAVPATLGAFEEFWRGPLVWMRIKDDGVNHLFAVSTDGENWQQVHSQSRTAYLTCNEIGIFAACRGATLGMGMTLVHFKVS